ncbi:putative methyltransferase DDB_G0268948 [Patiria miniata]|uniref:Methyltransferase type 11 domain-containing protein n=1 Tax=Patiria miniata TaxID=46514 RepID=A0A913ZCV5_PATMI|nr:putative methyltransferase DDB_G0268948 [Patiria miniata]
MSADTRRFEKEDHAAVYVLGRPDWPKDIIEKSIAFLREKKSKPFLLAVDVGCGSGQNTRPLAPHFEMVIGVDVSEAQIKAAQSVENPSNVEFRIGSGESIPVPDGSADMITVAEAVHWFDIDAFFREVDRVLKPCGCVAIYSCNMYPRVEGDDNKNQLLKDVVLKFDSFLAPYGSDRIRHVRNMLADIHIPYEETIRDDTLQIKHDTTLASFMNFVRSWSSYQGYRVKNPTGPDPVLAMQDRFIEILGLADCPLENAQISTSCPVVLLLGRKPENQPGN